MPRSLCLQNSPAGPQTLECLRASGFNGSRERRSLHASGFRFGFAFALRKGERSEEHTSELQSLMRISYAVFCLKKKNKTSNKTSIDRPINIVSIIPNLKNMDNTNTQIGKQTNLV